MIDFFSGEGGGGNRVFIASRTLAYHIHTVYYHINLLDCLFFAECPKEVFGKCSFIHDCSYIFIHTFHRSTYYVFTDTGFVSPTS